ncbi:MAG: ABC transporter ATP-binding protein [Myxococcaceae bacterium]
MTLAVSNRVVTLDGARLVDDLSLQLDAGQVHGVVGESGSGKTIAALSVLGLVPEGCEVAGTVTLDGQPLQGRRGVAMVLQEPLSALNPVLSIGAQLRETLAVHHGQPSNAAALLAEVGLGDAEALLRAYPHQLSGGQRQRVAIACALAAAPKVLIADEPTTALDASMKLVVLKLFAALAKQRRVAVWLITHDLLSLRGVADRLTVMYAGRAVEQGAAADVLDRPRHPYTHALLAAAPSRTAPGGALPVIEGQPPSPREALPGCRFQPRCARRIDRCAAERPPLLEGVACHVAGAA